MPIQPRHFQADSGFLEYKLYRRLFCRRFSSPHDSKNHRTGSFMANATPVDQIIWTMDESFFRDHSKKNRPKMSGLRNDFFIQIFVHTKRRGFALNIKRFVSRHEHLGWCVVSLAGSFYFHHAGSVCVNQLTWKQRPFWKAFPLIKGDWEEKKQTDYTRTTWSEPHLFRAVPSSPRFQRSLKSPFLSAAGDWNLTPKIVSSLRSSCPDENKNNHPSVSFR